ncbi:hypothetical protein B0H34DRAFT_180597 [Crassisporium funariophilum]|nr:hypothetical protein B0H34DRAFT_180597 [Crassisporium funariophilum]
MAMGLHCEMFLLLTMRASLLRTIGFNKKRENNARRMRLTQVPKEEALSWLPPWARHQPKDRLKLFDLTHSLSRYPDGAIGFAQRVRHCEA